MPRGMTGEPGPLAQALTSEISAEMAAQRISQAELARRIDKSKGYVSQRIRQEATWTVNDFEIIAYELGMDVYELAYRALERRRSSAVRGIAQDEEASEFDELMERAATVPQQMFSWERR